MLRNEQESTGTVSYLAPRAKKSYPFTNKLADRGWSEYLVLEHNDLLYITQNADALGAIVEDVNGELFDQLKRNPELLEKLSPRKFEELVASIFRREGFEAELTRATRDGGVDIYVTRNDLLGPLLYVIECKRYARSHKVGIEIVQRVHGVAQAKNATKGVVVTTSTYTKAAMDFARPLVYSLSLHNYEALAQWLQGH